MNKKLTCIMASTLLLINLSPITTALAKSNVKLPSTDATVTDQSTPTPKYDIERELGIIQKNIKYLNNKEKKQYKIILSEFKKTKRLTNQQRITLAKLKDSIVKNKLGSDYNGFIAIIKKDKNKLTDEEIKKLKYYLEKLQK